MMTIFQIVVFDSVQESNTETDVNFILKFFADFCLFSLRFAQICLFLQRIITESLAYYIYNRVNINVLL